MIFDDDDDDDDDDDSTKQDQRQGPLQYLEKTMKSTVLSPPETVSNVHV